MVPYLKPDLLPYDYLGPNFKKPFVAHITILCLIGKNQNEVQVEVEVIQSGAVM